MISRRILAAVALLCAFSFQANAQPFTKAQLNSQSNANIPDNNSFQVSPANVRTVIDNIINSIFPTAPVVTGNFPCFDGTTGLLKDCGLGPSAFFSGVNVVTNGATGNCTSDDTAAFQASINAAALSGGAGIVNVPAVPAGGCYRVGALNATNKSGIIVQGAGDSSLIKIIGKDASSNWADLSGSSSMVWRNLKIIDDGGTTIPGSIFLWSCVGSTGGCLTSGNMAGLQFDHVNIAAKSSYAFLYAYGFGNTGGATSISKAGGGSLTITNSTWTNSNNGPTNSNPWGRNALLHVDCLNSASLTSAYVTIPGNGQATTCSGATVINSHFVDAPAAFVGTGSFDNNAGIVVYNANAFTMVGGSVECLCDSLNVIWSDTQGVSYLGTVFNAADGGANDLRYSVNLGGGVNAVIKFDGVFWPPSLGPPIAIDAGTGAALGGVWNLTVIANNIGTSISTPFIGKTANGCGTFTATNNWLIAANLQFLTGANGITTCGSIDVNSIIQQPGAITLPGSSIDNSTHVGQSSNGSWTPVDNSGASLTFTSVSANWTRVGNMIFVYASFTYPTTASGTTASISGFPVASGNAAYAQQCTLSYSGSTTAARFLLAANGTTGTFETTAGVGVTNTQMSTTVNKILCTYPAS